MRRRQVLFTEVARDQVRAAKIWWAENTLPLEMFADEIEQAITFLAWLPGAGSLYPQAKVAGLRRIYLRRLSSHFYYTFARDAVTIRAFWHARRGRGPILPT